ncbi:transketolase [Anaeramoeba ignava]|uniref:Transketolase n=1 Tax=Anaeramoeba ignava TaxID=1746090 RepID=A0A9Q0LFW6_ANAIG|nr:transketolase [Anaeramoeba ignava]
MEKTELIINSIRGLCADMIQKANSGHPGAPLGCAPITHLLYSQHMTIPSFNPCSFPNRDRFILSNGHASTLLYSMLFLTTEHMKMEDLMQFRQIGSITPGHPEAHLTKGVEVTTGPLGQGFANAVGIAMAQKHLAARFNKDNFDIFNNHIYCLAGDGCLMEGISNEAASLAGHLKLGNLIVLYDSNDITIDGSTSITFTENVNLRFEALGWHVQTVEKGDADYDGINKAILEAKKVTDKPSLISVRTTIGFRSVWQGTSKVHGTPLGAENKNLFEVDKSVIDFYQEVQKKNNLKVEEWYKLFGEYRKTHPELAGELESMFSEENNNKFYTFDKEKHGDIFEYKKLLEILPKFGEKDIGVSVATRSLSGKCLNALNSKIPGLFGGSADLSPSNNTYLLSSGDFTPKNYEAKNIRFGVREHSMMAICNGIASCRIRGLVPYCATFLNFIQYGLPSVRLSAMSKAKVIYVMTHDSIGLGEDGPTHAPIETLGMLRLIPDLLLFRPCDGNEVSGAYAYALSTENTPSVLALTRQGVPHLKGTSVEAVAKGAYVLNPEVEKFSAIIVATGSEVSLAFSAAQILLKKGVSVRVVSMPAEKLFAQQPLDYKRLVFPKGIPILSVEAGATQTWFKYAHFSLGIDTFGVSAPANKIFAHFELVPEKVAEKLEKMVEYFKENPVYDTLKEF